MRKSTVSNKGVFIIRVNEDGSLGGPFPLTVALTPHNPPIQFSPSGGSFLFDVTVADTDTVGGRIDLWIEAIFPNGNTLEIAHREDVPLGPAGTLIRTDLQQTVPANAPAGMYQYTLYAGNYPYKSAWGQGSFTFEKQGVGDWGPRAGEWWLKGDFFGAEAMGAQQAAPLPPEAPHLSVSPNPFNASTTFTFTLPQAGEVKLEVFDIQGRNVGARLTSPYTTTQSRAGQALPLQGWFPAGTHKVTFDGSGLPSGVYLYRLKTSGSGTTPTMMTGKMVLLK